MEQHGVSYTAEQIDALLGRGELERLGMGSRRACYRLPGTDMCVKCYRSDAEIAEGRFPGCSPFMPLSMTVVREIRRYRFNEDRNTNCQEYRYWKQLKRRIPRDLMATFPSTMQPILLPTRGWCIMEECVLNPDGSSAIKFHEAWFSTGKVGRTELYKALRTLADNLVRNAVKVYDMQNILAQNKQDGTIRLRIADFEPASRALIALDSLSPTIVRMKLRRRFARYCRMFGINPP